MAFDRSAAVARSRRVVHEKHGLTALYEDDMTLRPVSLTVGWFNRMNLQGNMIEAGYNDVVEGVNRVRFNSEELAEKNVELRRGGVVTLTDPLNNGIVLVLDHLEPPTGPINVVWGVAQP
jgi:hypothetical protein